jgi:hypothetical protein
MAAEFPGQLAAADIHRMHFAGAVLQQAIREPSGRGAQVNRGGTLDR